MRKLVVIMTFISLIISNQVLFCQEKLTNEPLKEPVIKVSNSSSDARRTSHDGNISLIVFTNKNDQVSGYRYAKGLANALATSDKTGGNPVYATVFYGNELIDGDSHVKVFINGGQWSVEGYLVFSPNDAWKLLPQMMEDFVKENGREKILPPNVKPKLIGDGNK